MKPIWLDVLLAEKFFCACAKHDCWKKNEKNVFCLDCKSSICQHCLPDHNLHQLLQIRRYVYHDVIRLHDIHKLLDCSRVQAYTINNARVVFLKERPQPKSNKGLSGNCESCDRSLQDSYKFCSVACKVDMCFPTRQRDSKMECTECDTSTTSHQSMSSLVEPESCNIHINENVMGDHCMLDLDHLTTSTTSSESTKTAHNSSLSTHCNLNMRSYLPSIASRTSTPMLTRSHQYLATTSNMCAARRPRHNPHRYEPKSLMRSKPISTSLHSSLAIIPSSLIKRRKGNKPHRSPFS